VVNNVETLANLPHIFKSRCAVVQESGFEREKFRSQNTYCVSGHVNKPAVVERELGIPLPELNQ
jgi:NADH dehydrogenase (ubiquinone) flavoprotein 1